MIWKEYDAHMRCQHVSDGSGTTSSDEVVTSPTFSFASTPLRRRCDDWDEFNSSDDEVHGSMSTWTDTDTSDCACLSSYMVNVLGVPVYMTKYLRSERDDDGRVKFFHPCFDLVNANWSTLNHSKTIIKKNWLAWSMQTQPVFSLKLVRDHAMKKLKISSEDSKKIEVAKTRGSDVQIYHPCFGLTRKGDKAWKSVKRAMEELRPSSRKWMDWFKDFQERDRATKECLDIIGERGAKVSIHDDCDDDEEVEYIGFSDTDADDDMDLSTNDDDDDDSEEEDDEIRLARAALRNMVNHKYIHRDFTDETLTLLDTVPFDNASMVGPLLWELSQHLGIAAPPRSGKANTMSMGVVQDLIRSRSCIVLAGNVERKGYIDLCGIRRTLVDAGIPEEWIFTVDDVKGKPSIFFAKPKIRRTMKDSLKDRPKELKDRLASGKPCVVMMMASENHLEDFYTAISGTKCGFAIYYDEVHNKIATKDGKKKLMKILSKIVSLGESWMRLVSATLNDMKFALEELFPTTYMRFQIVPVDMEKLTRQGFVVAADCATYHVAAPVPCEGNHYGFRVAEESLNRDPEQWHGWLKSAFDDLTEPVRRTRLFPNVMLETGINVVEKANGGAGVTSRGKVVAEAYKGLIVMTDTGITDTCVHIWDEQEQRVVELRKYTDAQLSDCRAHVALSIEKFTLSNPGGQAMYVLSSKGPLGGMDMTRHRHHYPAVFSYNSTRDSEHVLMKVDCDNAPCGMAVERKLHLGTDWMWGSVEGNAGFFSFQIIRGSLALKFKPMNLTAMDLEEEGVRAFSTITTDEDDSRVAITKVVRMAKPGQPWKSSGTSSGANYATVLPAPITHLVAVAPSKEVNINNVLQIAGRGNHHLGHVYSDVSMNLNVYAREEVISILRKHRQFHEDLVDNENVVGPGMCIDSKVHELLQNNTFTHKSLVQKARNGLKACKVVKARVVTKVVARDVTQDVRQAVMSMGKVTETNVPNAYSVDMAALATKSNRRHAIAAKLHAPLKMGVFLVELHAGAFRAVRNDFLAKEIPQAQRVGQARVDHAHPAIIKDIYTRFPSLVDRIQLLMYRPESVTSKRVTRQNLHNATGKVIAQYVPHKWISLDGNQCLGVAVTVPIFDRKGDDIIPNSCNEYVVAKFVDNDSGKGGVNVVFEKVELPEGWAKLDKLKRKRVSRNEEEDAPKTKKKRQGGNEVVERVIQLAIGEHRMQDGITILNVRKTPPGVSNANIVEAVKRIQHGICAHVSMCSNIKPGKDGAFSRNALNRNPLNITANHYRTLWAYSKPSRQMYATIIRTVPVNDIPKMFRYHRFMFDENGHLSVEIVRVDA